MSLQPPSGAAVAELDPARGLIGASDAELRLCWAHLERRILASLTADWIVTTGGTHHGYDVLARSRLHVIGIGVQDSGLAELVVDFRSDLDPCLRARIPSSPQTTGALIFERLARFTPVTVLRAAPRALEAFEDA